MSNNDTFSSGHEQVLLHYEYGTRGTQYYTIRKFILHTDKCVCTAFLLSLPMFVASLFPQRPNEHFYQQYGSFIMHRYGHVSARLPETAAEAFAAGVTPTFQQFITYLLDPETEKQSIFNEHWRQVFITACICHSLSLISNVNPTLLPPERM